MQLCGHRHGKGIVFRDEIKYPLRMCFNFKDKADTQEAHYLRQYIFKVKTLLTEQAVIR